MSMSFSHISEELYKVQDLLLEACQLLEQVDFLPENSDLERWLDDERHRRDKRKNKCLIN